MIVLVISGTRFFWPPGSGEVCWYTHSVDGEFYSWWRPGARRGICIPMFLGQDADNLSTTLAHTHTLKQKQTKINYTWYNWRALKLKNKNHNNKNYLVFFQTKNVQNDMKTTLKFYNFMRWENIDNAIKSPEIEKN